MATKTLDKKRAVEKLVGRIGGEYYWCQYVFDHGDNFKGAVGSVMRPVSERERAERMDPENCAESMKEFWQSAVASGNTEDGLETWVETVLANDGESAVFDQSYGHAGDACAKMYNTELDEEHDAEEEAEFSECVGGGRCFKPDMKWDKLYDPKTWALIVKYETK